MIKYSNAFFDLSFRFGELKNEVNKSYDTMNIQKIIQISTQLKSIIINPIIGQ